MTWRPLRVLALPPLSLLLLLLVPVEAGCAASAAPEDGAEEAPLGSVRPADGELPPAAAPGGCTSGETAARPLRVYELFPATRSLGLGRGVVDGRAIDARWVEGTPVRDGSNVVASAFGAGPDLPNLGGWVGDPSPFLDTASSFAAEENPRRAWGDRNASTATRVGFAIAWYEKESEWFLDEEARAADAPSAPDPEARFVAAFAATRFFGATLAFDVTTCAASALEALLGGPAVVRRAKPGVDPVLGTILDPAKRTAIQELLVREGAQPYVSVISNRPRPEIGAAIRASRCSAADLGACGALLDHLQAASRALSTPPAPSRSADLEAGAGEWSVTDFRTKKLAFVRSRSARSAAVGPDGT